MITRGSLLLLLSLTATVLWQADAASDHLVTHLDVDHVEVTTRFQGQRILLFGSVPQGTDVIIKMVSPEQDVKLSRKSRIGPLWLTSGHLSVTGAPGFFYLASSRPLNCLLTAADRERLALTVESALSSAKANGDASLMAEWRSAFLRLKQNSGRYEVSEDAVRVDDGRLFYAHMNLPAEAPLGRYRLCVYLVRDGRVVQQREQNLMVKQVRLEEWLSHMVLNAPWLFGVLFTLGVMVLGLALGVILRPAREV